MCVCVDRTNVAQLEFVDTTNADYGISTFICIYKCLYIRVCVYIARCNILRVIFTSKTSSLLSVNHMKYLDCDKSLMDNFFARKVKISNLNGSVRLCGGGFT